MQNTNNKPEKHFKFGAVRATIWRDTRRDANGRTFETASISLDRSFKDARGEWQNSKSLRESDIFKAILALLQAYQYLTARENDDVIEESVD